MTGTRAAGVLALFLLIPAGAAAQETAKPPDAVELGRRIDAWVQPFAEAGHLSGTLLVARGDVVLYERSFGMANQELGVPNTSATLFNVASVAKPLTSIVALGVLADGSLRPEDTLAKWIPGFPRGDQ